MSFWKRIFMRAFVLFCLCSFAVSSSGLSSLWENPFQKIDLSNKLSLYYQKDTSSSITCIQILTKKGKCTEPPDKKGLSYLSLRLALEIPDRNKLQALMAQATRLSFVLADDYGMLTIQCLSDNLEETLKIISNIIAKPLISSIRIDRLKKMMTYYRDSEQDEAENIAHLTQQQNLYGNHPCSGSVYGTEKSVDAIKKKDIESYYKTLFHPAKAALIISSDLDRTAIVELAENYLAQIASKEKGASDQIPPFSPGDHRVSFIKKDGLQSLVNTAFVLDSASPRQIILGALLETALGKGIGSLMWPLRAKKKLAYSVNSRLTQMRNGGLLELYLKTDNDKRETASLALKQLIKKLYENGLTEDELQMTKAYSKSLFLRHNESKNIRTRTIASFLALGMDEAFINGYLQEIDKTSLEEINAFIKNNMAPEKGIEIIVGPEKEQALR